MNQSTPTITNSSKKQDTKAVQLNSFMAKDERIGRQCLIEVERFSVRGSIKKSSQQALSGSNHMNLSLSQASSRGLPKSHIDTSVDPV